MNEKYNHNAKLVKISFNVIMRFIHALIIEVNLTQKHYYNEFFTDISVFVY